MVDAEELGVTRHRAQPVLGRAGAHDDGAAQPPGHLARAQARGAPRRPRPGARRGEAAAGPRGSGLRAGARVTGRDSGIDQDEDQEE